MRDKYGDARRTEIIGAADDINIEDLIAEEDVVVTLTHQGYIKRTPASLNWTSRCRSLRWARRGTARS